MRFICLIISLFTFSMLWAQSNVPMLDLREGEGRKIGLHQDDLGDHFYGFGYTAGKLEFYVDKTAASTLPNVAITDAGNLGIGLSNPDRRLQVRGDAKIEGEIHDIVNGDANMLPIAYGTIDSGGSKVGGTNNLFASRASVGSYTLLVNNVFLSSSNCVVLITPITFNQALFANVTYAMGAGIIINIYDMDGTRQDAFFMVTVLRT